MLSIFDISGSALRAQSQRLNVSASNLANADSVTGPNGQPYVAKQVIFATTPMGGTGIGGVSVAGIVDDPSPMKRIYHPQHPLADDQGYVTQPNVNVVAETVNSISASRSYQANVEVLNSVKSLMLKTLTLGQ